MEQTKYLEYYFDSRIYSADDVQQKIDETKQDFPNKKVKVSISLNEFGVYIITFKFENKKIKFNKIILKIKRKFKKIILLEKKK